MGFGREGLVHFMYSFHCIGCISLSSPWRFGVKVHELITLGFLEP
jgi:hypothetical protein